MAKAIATGLPKQRIEETATRTQAAIDTGQQKIIGVNRCQQTDQKPEDEMIEVLRIDTDTVREQQIARLEHLRKTRNSRATETALAALESAARGTDNLLAAAVAAARAGATRPSAAAAARGARGRESAGRSMRPGRAAVRAG